VPEVVALPPECLQQRAVERVVAGEVVPPGVGRDDRPVVGEVAVVGRRRADGSKVQQRVLEQVPDRHRVQDDPHATALQVYARALVDVDVTADVPQHERRGQPDEGAADDRNPRSPGGGKHSDAGHEPAGHARVATMGRSS